MSEGGGGAVTGGKFKPFKGTNMFSNMGNALAGELEEDANIVKQQVGLNPQAKRLPQNLSQTKKIQQIQSQATQTEQDQKDIAKLNAEIQEMIQNRRAEIKRWDEELIVHDQQKKQQEKQQEEQELLAKKQQEEQRKMAEPLVMPTGKQTGPNMGGKKKSTTPLVVKQAVDKDIGRQAKG